MEMGEQRKEKDSRPDKKERGGKCKECQVCEVQKQKSCVVLGLGLYLWGTS